MDNSVTDFFPEHQRPGLFRSLAWLNAWQQHWGDSVGVAPLLIDAKNPADSLYCVREKIKGVVLVRTAFPMGIPTAGARSIRSEYFCFAKREQDSLAAILRYFNNLRACRWDQFLVPDLLLTSNEYPLLLEQAKARSFKVVERERSTTYAVALQGISFNDYLAGLGKNTRLKLFNRRKNLQALGDVVIENCWPNIETFWQTLNDFHQQRWGKPCYEGRQQAFITTVVTDLHAGGHEVIFSTLKVNGRVVSVMFDVCVNGRQYNIQSGYLENFAHNISLGTLHLGYQIESAFNNSTIEFYDFMAGTGKNNDYKGAIANCRDEFVTLVIVRNPFLKLVYALYGQLQAWRAKRDA